MDYALEILVGDVDGRGETCDREATNGPGPELISSHPSAITGSLLQIGG